MAVVVIVNFTCREQGMYAQDALNIWANSHSTILPQSSVQRVGHIFRSLRTVCLSCAGTKVGLFNTWRGTRYVELLENSEDM